MLLRGFRVLNKRLGNDDYSASDHKMMLADVQLSHGVPHSPKARRQFTVKTFESVMLVLILLLGWACYHLYARVITLIKWVP